MGQPMEHFMSNLYAQELNPGCLCETLRQCHRTVSALAPMENLVIEECYLSSQPLNLQELEETTALVFAEALRESMTAK